MKRSKIRSLLLLHALLLLYSCGGIFSKMAASEPALSIKWLLCYGVLLMILGIYAIFWQQIIRVLPLNTAYLNKSVTMLWTALWGVLFFHETIQPTYLIGGGLVMAGILLIITEKDA